MINFEFLTLFYNRWSGEKLFTLISFNLKNWENKKAFLGFHVNQEDEPNEYYFLFLRYESRTKND